MISKNREIKNVHNFKKIAVYSKHIREFENNVHEILENIQTYPLK
jgi:hypothetical protein